MSGFRFRLSHRTVAWLLALLLLPSAAVAGGPKYVAGVSYFNSGVLGQPVHWANGQLNYYVDQGPLNASVTNKQATAMVDAAAALWSAVTTAGVTLTDKGQLNEDVSGANITISGTGFTVTNEQTNQKGVITAPADLTPSATGYPVGVVFDEDGSVIDAIFGTGVAAQNSCQNNGVYFWLDNINTDATIAHAVIVLNGLCATSADKLEMMSFELERAFGRILGLDYSQVNPGATTSGEANVLEEEEGWPVMQPVSGLCSSTGGACIPDPAVLRWDDIAALNRLYPITAANLASFPGKQITAASTVSIQGTISFGNGLGMQGVNVVARPLDASGNPMYQYTISAVSGSTFNGNHGNPVTGWDDTNGNLLTMWGSNEADQQGYFDLSGMPLPPGATTANYEVTFEAIDPLSILSNSVGPYLDGSPTPSGTLSAISVTGLAAGTSKTLTVSVEDSAVGGENDAIGSENAPRMLPVSGLWSGRLSQVGQSDWFTFSVRGGRTFTVFTEALDESGAPSIKKAMPALGVWDAFDAAGSAAVGFDAAFNGQATGESWLQITTSGDDIVRLGIADERGDGRPDYAYEGRVLYADTVYPQHLAAAGGAIVIHGMGFRSTDSVLVGGQAASVISVSPNEITAIAPASTVIGSVDVEVDDLPIYQLRRCLRRRAYADERQPALGHDPHRRAGGLLRHRSGREPDSGWRSLRHLHREKRNRNLGLRQLDLHGNGHRRRPRHHESDGHRQHLLGRDRLAHQRFQPAGSFLWWHASRPGRAFVHALAGRRSYDHLDGRGLGAEQRCASQRPVRRLADDFEQHHHSQRRRHHQHQRHRRQGADCGAADRGRNRHRDSLPERHQPVRYVHRLRRTPGIRHSPRRLRHHAEPFSQRHGQPDYAARAGHGRQPHGRRNGHALSGALCLGLGLLHARTLRPERVAGHRKRHSHLRLGRKRHLQPGVAGRCRHQHDRHRRHRRHQQRQHRHRAASVRQGLGVRS
jgi:hypothetical protein